ncbi:protein-export membrane protein SecF [Mycolicibacillus koreensis]|nr:protein-export membrane protein SecF [Mycolicibacillus koreensis]
MSAKTTTTDDGMASGATELTASPADAQMPHHGFLNRLYTGTGAFEVIGKRRLWYAVSGAMFVLSIAAILIRGFTFGIDFEGGTTVSFPRGDAEVSQVQQVFSDSVGFAPEAVVEVGSGGSKTIQIRSQALDTDQTAALKTALFDAFHPLDAEGQPSESAISDSAVSETWGGQITIKAAQAIVVFLVLVALYITVRYERYMALSALASLVFDLVVTAGVYAAVGFEVTPATVIGWLTILGFSIYDTVIVFDKVEENTHGFQHTTRRTYAEQANLAVNQTFMRSINTSLIAVIPVVALMVVAVWLLGVGMLKDLALVQLVGIIVGTYSSIYFATPLLVSMRERTELVRNHTRKVLKRRNRTARADTADTAEPSDATPEEADDTAAPATDAAEAGTAHADTATSSAAKPAPGAKPNRPTRSRQGRPSGKRR